MRIRWIVPLSVAALGASACTSPTGALDGLGDVPDELWAFDGAQWVLIGPSR